MGKGAKLGSIAAVVAVVAVGGWLAFGRGETEVASADAGNAALVALGRDVYGAQCAACHGADLEGQANWRSPLPTGGRPAPPHDANGHTWHHPDQQLFAITKWGGQRYSPPGDKNQMPGFADRLSDREIWASLAYIKSRWPEAIRQRHDGINARAR